MLERLFDPDKLEELPVVRQLGWDGMQVRDIIQGILADGRPMEPLTLLEKEILIASYLRKDRNKSQLAKILPYEQSHLLPSYAFGRKTSGFCVKRFDAVRILGTHSKGVIVIGSHSTFTQVVA